MEAAGRAVAEARRGGRRRRARCGSSAARATTAATGWSRPATWPRPGYEVEVLLLWPAGELSADAAANLERFDGAARELEPGDAGGGARAAPGAVVDAIFGTGFEGAPRDPAAAAIEAINGCGAPVVAADIASGVDASTGEVEGAAVEATLTVSLPRAPSSATGSRPASATPASCGWRRSGSRDGAPRERARRPDPRRGARAARPPRRRLDQVQLRPGAGRRRLARAHRRRLHVAPRRRPAPAPATRPSRCPAELEPIFEVKLTEVMSLGCPSADGRLDARRRRARSLEAAERAAAVVLGPGLGRAERAPRAGRRARGADRGAAGDRRRRAQRARRAARAARRRARRRPCSPRTRASSGGCSEIDSDEVGAQRLASAREAAERARRDRRAQGRRHDRRRARRRADRQRPRQPGAGDRRHRRRAQRDDRRAARPRAGAASRGRRRRPRARPRRARRRRAGRRRRVGDRRPT